MGLRNRLSRRLGRLAVRRQDDFLHVVATKIAIGVFNEQWLDYRQELFEALTLPSIDAQTERGFVWVLGVDRAMPERFRKRLDELCGSRPYVRLLEVELFDDFGPDLIRWCRREAAARGRSHLLTTRIDSDDALHRDLFARIHEVAREQLAAKRPLPAAITPTTGYQWVPATGQGFRAFHFSHSMGTSLLESVDDFAMVYTKNHRKLPDWVVERGGSVRAIDGHTPWWLYATTNTSLMLLRNGRGLRDDTLANAGAHELDAGELREFGVTDAYRLRGLREPVYVDDHMELDERGRRIDRQIKQVRQELRERRRAGEPEDPGLVAKHAELHAQRRANAEAWIV
jgi:hypothetical protein